METEHHRITKIGSFGRLPGLSTDETSQSRAWTTVPAHRHYYLDRMCISVAGPLAGWLVTHCVKGAPNSV